MSNKKQKAVFNFTFKDIWTQIKSNKIVHLFIWGFGIVFVYILISFFISEKPNKVDIDTEICGFLLDIFLFGIILTIYNGLVERNKLIRNYHEQFDDYRFWKEAEGIFRKVGIIKRLNILRAPLPNMFKVILNKAILQSVDLHGAFLIGANLSMANLQGAILENTNLIRAILRGSSLQGVNFRGANLNEAYLQGANFSRAKHMTWGQMEGAIFGINTKLPAYLKETKPDSYIGKFDDEIK